MQLSIIIVNYNVKHFLEQCLYTVKAAIRKLQTEVFVVDNNSTDGSLAYLQPAFPWVKWIANNQNTGFGVANNQAVAVATGQYILFLNPDTLLPEDCLEKCIGFMQQQPKAGALGIRMLDGSGQYLPESKRGFPSPLTSLFKLSGLTALFPHSGFFAPYYLGHLSNTQNHVADVLAGAFMLVRHAVLQQTGAFDERFFMYGEDIDLSFRIQKAGWQNWYFADSQIIHFKGESTKKGSRRYVQMFYEAMNLFVKKHYNNGSALLYRGLIQTAIGAKAGISTIGTFARQLFKTHSENATKEFQLTGSALVIGSEKSFSGIQQLLKLSGKQPKLTQIHPSALFAQLPALLVHNNWQQIVFGVDETFLMKTAISVMQQYPQLPYAFYYHPSRCVISSTSKETSGQWISAG